MHPVASAAAVSRRVARRPLPPAPWSMRISGLRAWLPEARKHAVTLAGQPERLQAGRAPAPLLWSRHEQLLGPLGRRTRRRPLQSSPREGRGEGAAGRVAQGPYHIPPTPPPCDHRVLVTNRTGAVTPAYCAWPLRPRILQITCIQRAPLNELAPTRPTGAPLSTLKCISWRRWTRTFADRLDQLLEHDWAGLVARQQAQIQMLERLLDRSAGGAG